MSKGWGGWGEVGGEEAGQGVLIRGRGGEILLGQEPPENLEQRSDGT